MEDILDVYARPHNPQRPLVCFDETNKQQHRAVIEHQPTAQSHVKRIESTYERNGVSNLFLWFAPLENWREVKVIDRRTHWTLPNVCVSW